MKTPLPPEFDAMAQRFVDLWQEQWVQFANNKDTATAMQRMTELMATPNPFNQFFQQAGQHDYTAPFRQAAAAGAKAAPVTLESVALQLAQLSARVDALSQQLDAMAQSQSGAEAARAKPAATKSKPTGKRAGTGSREQPE